MNRKMLFLAQMIGLSFLLFLLPIPLLSLFIVPLVMVVCGFYQSYLFTLGSVYFGILAKPGDPTATFLFTFLFKLSALLGISPYALIVVCFGLALPFAIFVGMLAIYKPVCYVQRRLLRNRVRLD
jgi:hypothetical protein